MRRSAFATLGISMFAVFTGMAVARAGDGGQGIAVSNSASVDLTIGRYRGYFLDISEIAKQPSYSGILDSLHRQLDIAESVGLGARVLEFFHTIPIISDEEACSGASTEDGKPIMAEACYGPSIPAKLQNRPTSGSYWDNKKSRWVNDDPVALAQDTGLGVIMARTRKMNPERPILLHELLHAYHANILIDGFENPAIKHFYDNAKSKGLYPTDAYLMTNEREFFAVTASVLLFGKDGNFTRADIKGKQPDYYRYLTWLFQVDPDQGVPVASAN